jgi:hypothetical protein
MAATGPVYPGVDLQIDPNTLLRGQTILLQKSPNANGEPRKSFLYLSELPANGPEGKPKYKFIELKYAPEIALTMDTLIETSYDIKYIGPAMGGRRSHKSKKNRRTRRRLN